MRRDERESREEEAEREMAREDVSASRWEEGNRSDQNNRRTRVSTHPTGRRRWSIIGENVCFFVYEPIPR